MGVLVGIEAAWRAWRQQPHGRLSGWLDGLLLLAVGVTIAGGLGLFVAGGRPAEPLHFVYGVLAFGAVPIASSVGRRAFTRRSAIATVIGALVAVVLIVRLFQTG
jgi:hypothetical protein